MSEVYGPECHQDGIAGYGNLERGIVFVGIAPARDEIKTKKPFQGPAGQLFNALLESVGWEREDVYMTNIVCWRTMDGNKNRDPYPEEIERCLPRLHRELVWAKPRIIIPLGATPAGVLTGSTSIGSVRGKPRWNKQFNCYVMPTYHPSAILQGSRGFIHDICRDFAKIIDILKWEPDHYKDPSFDYITDKDEAQHILDNLSSDKLIGLDVETRSFSEDEVDVFDAGLLCWAISEGDRTWVFEGNLVNQLEWPDKQWVFQNGLFDVQAIAHATNGRVWLKIHEDTMLQSYSLDERGGVHGLKPLSAEYLGADEYAEKLGKHKDIADVPRAQLHPYNATDARNTQQLSYILGARQRADDVYDFYKELLVPAANAFSEIQYNGVPINRVALKDIGMSWAKKWMDGEDYLVGLASEEGWPGNINLNSHSQLKNFINNNLHVPVLNTQFGTIMSLQGKHAFLDNLIEWRTLDHAFSVYIKSLMAQIRKDGRIHPNPKLHGTDTGRRSYTDPPIQNIPKDDRSGSEPGKEELKRARELFGFDDGDGEYVIIEADYKSGEIWVSYILCRDKQLGIDLTTPDPLIGKVDMHISLASQVFGKPTNTVTGYERIQMKLLRFGVMYRMGAKELSRRSLSCQPWCRIDHEHKQVSPSKAQIFINAYWDRYPGYKEYCEELEHKARSGDDIISHTGRKRRLRMIDQSDFHSVNQAINFPIQSLLSDFTLDSLIKLHTALKPLDSKVLFDCHDSLVIEARRKHLPEVIHTVNTIMAEPKFGLDMGIPVEIKAGMNWKEAHLVEDEM